MVMLLPVLELYRSSYFIFRNLLIGMVTSRRSRTLFTVHFVAHSVESWVVGKDDVGGTQVEITPYKSEPSTYVYYAETSPPRYSNGKLRIFGETLTGRIITLVIDFHEGIGNPKERCHRRSSPDAAYDYRRLRAPLLNIRRAQYHPW